MPNKEKISEAVGVGAVIFGDLKHHRQLSVDFSLEDAVSFDRETGPYLQYTMREYAACSGRAIHPALHAKYPI